MQAATQHLAPIIGSRLKRLSYWRLILSVRMAKQHAEEELAALADGDQLKDSLEEIDADQLQQLKALEEIHADQFNALEKIHAEWVKIFDKLLEKETWVGFDKTGILLSYPLRRHYDRINVFYDALPAEFEKKHGTNHKSWPKLGAYLERLLEWLELIDFVVGDSRDPYSDQGESYCSSPGQLYDYVGSAHGSSGDEEQSNLESSTRLSGPSCRGSLHGDCSVRLPASIGSDVASSSCHASQKQGDPALARTCSVTDETYRSPKAVQKWIAKSAEELDQSVTSSHSPE